MNTPIRGIAPNLDADSKAISLVQASQYPQWLAQQSEFIRNFLDSQAFDAARHGSSAWRTGGCALAASSQACNTGGRAMGCSQAASKRPACSRRRSTPATSRSTSTR